MDVYLIQHNLTYLCIIDYNMDYFEALATTTLTNFSNISGQLHYGIFVIYVTYVLYFLVNYYP